MKKSQMYVLAQCSVIESPNMTAMTKLEIIRELIEAEDLELYKEKRAEEEAKEKANEAV